MAEKGLTFFVYTKHGYHLERIVFNAEFWTAVVVCLELILTQFVDPELLTGIIKSKLEVSSIATPLVHEKRIAMPGVSGRQKKQRRLLFM